MNAENPQGPPVVLVAAVADNGVIGAAGALPWRLPSDLRRFRAMTTGKPVIMGRRTFESIGKPLPGRTNIVVSRTLTSPAPGVVLARSLEEALVLGAAAPGAAEAVCVIGGAEVYALALPFARELWITHVAAAPQGDARFPDIDPALWRAEAAEPVAATPQDTAAMRFVRYRRVGTGRFGDAGPPNGG